MAKETATARAERLAAENETLRIELAAAKAPEASARGARWRAPVAAVLIVVGVLLAPVALVASVARVQLEDTETFVGALAPLASDPEVQALIVDESVAAIEAAVDLDALTAEVFDGIAALGLPPRASDALGLLAGPAAAGLRSLVHDGVTSVVESPAFAEVWERALRVTHQQLVSGMRGDRDSALVLGRDGTVGVQLGPIIAEAREQLLAQGITIARLVPDVDRTIEVTRSDALGQAVVAYHLVVTLGLWLPWLAALFIIAGVLVARARARAALVASLAIAGVVGLVGLALVLGRAAFLGAVAGAIPSGAAGVVFDALAGSLVTAAVVLLVLAVVGGLVAYLAGPFPSSTALRARVRSALGRPRSA
jgi:hypothetical protein